MFELHRTSDSGAIIRERFIMTNASFFQTSDKKLAEKGLQRMKKMFPGKRYHIAQVQ